MYDQSSRYGYLSYSASVSRRMPALLLDVVEAFPDECIEILRRLGFE